MSCCDGWDLKDEPEEKGECPDCGVPTIGGQAIEGCHYSPVLCKTCGDAPCDLSC